jgi:hypothetical protein
MRNIIKKLNSLLRLNFASYKTIDGGEMVCEDELEVGSEIYSITDNGQLPASTGEYELEDSTKIKVEDGIIKEITYENEMEENKDFTKATLADGTVLESPTFDVGETVEIVGEDGSKTKAPDGEHQIMLKDSSGKEVKIRIITEDGIIKERDNVEEMADLSDINDENTNEFDTFMKEMKDKVSMLEEKMASMEKRYENMSSEVEKFSKEPAGNPINQPKNIVTQMENYKSDKFSQLRAIRNGNFTK